jgi:hypothetical protein
MSIASGSPDRSRKGVPSEREGDVLAVCSFPRLAHKKPHGLAGQPGTDSAKTPLFISSVCINQRDARDDRNSAHDRRQRDVLLLFGRDFEGAYIDQLLLSCIADPLIGQSQDS